MRKLILLSLLLLPAFLLQAQKEQPYCDGVAEQLTEAPQQHRGMLAPIDQEEIQSKKIAFLSSALDLNPAEAAAFWPVYNEWGKKMEENLKARHAALKQIRQLSKEGSADEKAYSELAQRLVDGSAQEADIVAQAYKAYIPVLGPIKTAKLYVAEERFRGVLIRELQQKPRTPEQARDGKAKIN